MKPNARSVFQIAVFCAALGSSRAAPSISYISGPMGCSPAPGYLDLPFCTIPNEIPLGSFVPPPTGQSYVDANMGGTVTTLSSATGWVHAYSLPSPVSAHNKYVFLQRISDGGSSIVNSATGQQIYGGVPYSGYFHAWDAYNDDIYYYFSGTKVVRHTLSTNQDTVLVDYASDGHGFNSITTGGSSETSKDNWIAFWAPNQHQVCALDLGAVHTYCADYMASPVISHVGWNWLDYSMITKGVDLTTGKRFVLLMGSPAMGMWSVNTSTGQLDFELRGPENSQAANNGNLYCDPGESCLGAPHADLFEDSNGKQYMALMADFSAQACGRELATIDLSTGLHMYTPTSLGGGLNGILMLAQCGDVWPDGHIGCAKQSPYCVFSMYQDALRSPTDLTTPFQPGPHRDEVMVMRGNGQEVRFLSISRSVQFTNDSYYGEPRAAISPDGSLVITDSNFGVPNAEQVTAVPTTFGAAPPPPPPPPPPPEVVTVSPTTVSVAPAQSVQFTATVTNGPPGVTWSVSPPLGRITSSGLYTAPPVVAAQYTVTVKATSTSDPTKAATAQVTLLRGAGT